MIYRSSPSTTDYRGDDDNNDCKNTDDYAAESSLN